MGHSLVQEFITKDYQASVQAVLDRALDGKETANFEFPLITKGGARIEVLLNATTRRNEHGRVIGVVGIGQDITGRIAQEREYAKLIDTANAPIFGVDSEGKVNVWNKVSLLMLIFSYPHARRLLMSPRYNVNVPIRVVAGYKLFLIWSTRYSFTSLAGGRIAD